MNWVPKIKKFCILAGAYILVSAWAYAWIVFYMNKPQKWPLWGTFVFTVFLMSVPTGLIYCLFKNSKRSPDEK